MSSVSEAAPEREWFRENRGDGKVVRGKDGWLFLDYDSNEVMLQHFGELQFTDGYLDQWQRLIGEPGGLARQARDPVCLSGRAQSSRRLPGQASRPRPPNPRPRPLLQLLEHLERKGSDASLLYPLDDLIAERREEGTYSATDTHSSDLGAFVAYRRLAEELETVPMRRLAEAEINWHRRDWEGDLGMKVTPNLSSVHVYAIIEDGAGAAHLRQPRTSKRSPARVWCASAPDLKCLVLADSFGYAMLPLLAESFRHVVCGHISTLDYELVEQREARRAGQRDDRALHDPDTGGHTCDDARSTRRRKAGPGGHVRAAHIGHDQGGGVTHEHSAAARVVANPRSGW